MYARRAFSIGIFRTRYKLALLIDGAPVLIGGVPINFS